MTKRVAAAGLGMPAGAPCVMEGRRIPGRKHESECTFRGREPEPVSGARCFRVRSVVELRQPQCQPFPIDRSRGVAVPVRTSGIGQRKLDVINAQAGLGLTLETGQRLKKECSCAVLAVC